MTTKTARTPAQKAAHAARERARYAARKQAENRPAEIEAEQDTATDFVADAVAAAIENGTVSLGETITALTAGATLEDVAAALPAPDLSTMDTITLYRKVQEEVAARRTDPDIATPHLDELTARKGRKVIAGKPEKAVAKTSTSKRPARHPLFEQAETERKRLANKRGKGTKVTDAETVDVARRLAAAGLVERQAMEVAYWVEKLAVSRGSWAKAWTTATSPVEEGAAI